jgi:hypothetical protein
MTGVNESISPVVEWAWAGSALEGGVSGDRHLVVAQPQGAVLAVIDGLGHGPSAAEASCEAVWILEAHATRPLLDLVERCHAGLRHTRGAVMCLARLDASTSTLEWCGVGNVEGVLMRWDRGCDQRDETVMNRGGVVGYRLPPLRASTCAAHPRDVLVLATDGIALGFAAAVERGAEPESIVSAVMAGHAKGTDDALVLVARFKGTS